MQRILLPVVHFQQPQTGECLPTCFAMVLHYRGVEVHYAQLTKLLDTIPGFGTPSFRLLDAVVVVGMSGSEIYLNDPAIVQAPIAVPLGDFDLAWLERDELYAALTD